MAFVIGGFSLMFEAETRTLDSHFGHSNDEGPVTFVLKALATAQSYGSLSTADMRAFLAAMTFLRTSTDAGEFIGDRASAKPAFTRCWATLKQGQHSQGDFVTRDVRAFIINEMKVYPVGNLVHYDVNGHHGELTRRLREYEFASIERQAMRLALCLYEDILIHVALEQPVIRNKINRAMKTDQGNSARRRGLAIQAESEARTQYDDWKPLRRYMQSKLPAVLEASP